jgi:TRAP-type C4-dicarboxylate transport system substrate-binding protein
MRVFWIAAALAAGAAHAQTIEWKLASGYRAESFQTQNLLQFAQQVGEATQGQLRIQVHPNNSLLKLAEIPAAVQAGRVQAGETIMANLVKDIPIAGADSIPFVVSSYADARRMWQLQRPLIEQHFAKRELKVLYAVPWPPQGLYAARPIRAGADFKGSHMRTYNQSTIRIAEMLGAAPVDVPMVEVNQALASGRIDSMITSAVTGVENRVWDHIKHYYEINAWFPKNIVFVNAKAFAQLKPAVQQQVMAAAKDAEQRGWDRSQAVMREATADLKANGMKIERVPADFENELKRLGERFSREWVRSVGNEANAIFVPYYVRQE